MLDKNVKAYLSAIEAAVIYVLVEDGKPVLIGVAKNLDVVTRKLVTKKYGWIAWGRNYDELNAICRFRNIEVLLKKNLKECVEGIVQITESRKIVLTPHEVVMERAKNLAGTIERRFRELKSSGELGHFNRAYQHYRLEQQKKGKPVLPYFGVVERFKRIIIKGLIEGKDRNAISQIVRKEFPWMNA
jgi:hypothetical protein